MNYKQLVLCTLSISFIATMQTPCSSQKKLWNTQQNARLSQTELDALVTQAIMQQEAQLIAAQVKKDADQKAQAENQKKKKEKILELKLRNISTEYSDNALVKTESKVEKTPRKRK